MMSFHVNSKIYGSGGFGLAIVQMKAYGANTQADVSGAQLPQL